MQKTGFLMTRLILKSIHSASVFPENDALFSAFEPSNEKTCCCFFALHFCIYVYIEKNKYKDQLHNNCAADQYLCFHYMNISKLLSIFLIKGTYAIATKITCIQYIIQAETQ